MTHLIKESRKGITKKGQETIDIAKKHNLYNYYDEIGGYFDIPCDELTKEIEHNIFKCLFDLQKTFNKEEWFLNCSKSNGKEVIWIGTGELTI